MVDELAMIHVERFEGSRYQLEFFLPLLEQSPESFQRVPVGSGGGNGSGGAGRKGGEGEAEGGKEGGSKQDLSKGMPAWASEVLKFVNK